ncbi:MAG: ABC transporter ATP-binding protein [Treponema sp.]|jgi:ABC-2 type transport system ATP-binding protein|nr:ABC transporter ATP-binding protein [Treponema sp.]
MSEPILECRGLSKRYGHGDAMALDQVNLSLYSGRIIGLLGPNGSGKTTLLKLANGLLRPSSGSLLINGDEPGTATKAIVSYLPDRVCLDPSSRICDLMAFYADFYADFRRGIAETMLANLGIDLNKRFKTLSKGNREKIQLVLVMARKARLYLLDEPIGGVDPAARDYIINTILNNYSEDAALLISTHLIQDVERILDDIIFLKEGKVILSGATDDIRSKKSMSIDMLFREVFKC